MGKWAQYAKRGGNKSQGFLAPLADSDWSLGTPGVTTIAVTRFAAFPTGADRWGCIVVKVSDGTLAFSTFQTVSPINVTGLTTLTNYRAYVAWFVSGSFARISDWSLAKTFTTT